MSTLLRFLAIMNGVVFVICFYQTDQRWMYYGPMALIFALWADVLDLKKAYREGK